MTTTIERKQAAREQIKQQIKDLTQTIRRFEAKHTQVELRELHDKFNSFCLTDGSIEIPEFSAWCNDNPAYACVSLIETRKQYRQSLTSLLYTEEEIEELDTDGFIVVSPAGLSPEDGIRTLLPL